MASNQFGDPAALSATAAVLSERAASVASIARDVEQRFATIEFEGPAADRVRAELTERRQHADALANQLLELAAAMQQTAVWAEQQHALAQQAAAQQAGGGQTP